MVSLVSLLAMKLPKTYLLISDDIPTLPNARIFNPLKHSLNPLKDDSYLGRCRFVDTIDAIFSSPGEARFTKELGLDFIHECLAKKRSLSKLIPAPDKKSTTGHQWAYSKIQRLLLSPVLKKMLTSRINFAFTDSPIILARINEKEIGRFDARAITFFLIAHYKGTIVIPKYGSYFHFSHLPMIRDGRLIVSGALYDDAVLIAKNKGLIPGTNEYNDFIQAALVELH